jgi:hypothetical protein
MINAARIVLISACNHIYGSDGFERLIEGIDVEIVSPTRFPAEACAVDLKHPCTELRESSATLFMKHCFPPKNISSGHRVKQEAF